MWIPSIPWIKPSGLVGILEAIQIEGIAFFDAGLVPLDAAPVQSNVGQRRWHYLLLFEANIKQHSCKELGEKNFSIQFKKPWLDATQM
jgi:hypothetical protein